MKKAICTGSFDPVTNGHVNIFERATKLVDELIVCIFINSSKKYLFSPQERIDLLRESTSHIDNLRVDYSDGLVADYLKKNDINIIIRGVRSVADFSYELNPAQITRHLFPNAETLLMFADPKFLFISSSEIRELTKFGGNVHALVPECVEIAIKSKQNS